MGIGSSSSCPCPSLWTGLPSPTLCSQRFAGANSKAPKWEWGTVDLSGFKKELIALTKQVSDLFDQIERTNRIAFQEKKTLDMAISNIAHDIRTPLTIASGYTQQIIKGGTQEEEKLKKIASNLQVVSKRLESLLEYRRLMEGAIQPRISDVNLSQVLTQQLFQYYDSLSEAGIALEVELEEHLHYATDPELWERLLQNMLSNVLKHGKDQARLTLMSDADTIRVELRNIVQQPIQHLDQLASRFYSENLSDTEESSGLGLYIIQNFVEILGETCNWQRRQTGLS